MVEDAKISPLDYFLGRCYEEEVIKNSSAYGMIDILKKRLQANQNLRKEAKQRLTALTDPVTKKCFVSKKQREFLMQALEETK